MQKTRELTALLGLLWKDPPKYALEIGGMKGGTAWAWAQLGAKVVVVDLFVLEGRMEHGPEDYCLVEGDSHLEATRDRAAVLPFDFLFIDGDHSYPGVRRDFELYAPLVRTGGVVALHDVSVEQPAKVRDQHDVVPYWNQVRRLYEHEEIFDQTGPSWGGIGVLHMPDKESERTEALTSAHQLDEPAPEDRVATVPCDEPCGRCGKPLAAGNQTLCTPCARIQ